MTFVTIGATCEAYGHPTECDEPAIGSVIQTSSHGIINTNESGETKEIATVDTADISFDSHSHNYSAISGCGDNKSHTIDPDAAKLPSITINGSQVYVMDNPVATDPASGGDVVIADTGSINNVTQK